MEVQTKRLYEFGPFHLDAGERLLLRDSQPVPLTPKAFDTLLLLVENSGHLVEKADLLRAVWPDTAVEENNLNRSIYVLRKALGEADGAKYIETVPKSGYRFVMGVVEVQADAADLIVERRTSAEIITEEEEEVTDPPNAEAAGERATLAARAAARAGLFARLRRPAWALLVVALLVAVVYWWRVGQPSQAATTVRLKSIAVLPFRDIGASGDEHLGLSLADVLITRLGNLKAVQVRPTSAVLKLEGQEQESNVAGRLLGVDAVLEGSIYRSREQIRVTARLVRVSDRSPIWSGQFDNRVGDVLTLENAIAEQVADALTLSLSADEKANLSKPYSDSADALQLYAKGRYYWNTRTWPGMDQAQYFFRRAIEKDPNFALAYVGLADQLVMSGPNPEVVLAIRKAIELDPNLGEAYATSGFTSMFHNWDWQRAEASLKQAIALRPGYGTAHQWYATLLAITGRVDEAKREVERALEIDPRSANFLADTGQMYYFARQYDEAEAYCRKALEVEPEFIFAHEYLSAIYFKTGRYSEAFEEALKQQAAYSADPKYADQKGEYEAEARAVYQESGMKGFLQYCINMHLRVPLKGYCYQVARLQMLLGDNRQALAWLEKSYESKEFLLPFVNADPVFEDLHAEPRYQAILRGMNLAPQR
jgi:DNA-binding winged helix-turn-helix (wHTH) protein/TolB-like protein/cytochrome c-type biogenesis protein CcmH/NrfG